LQNRYAKRKILWTVKFLGSEQEHSGKKQNLQLADGEPRLFISALSLRNYKYPYLLERPLDLEDDSNIAHSYPIRVLGSSELLHIENGGRYGIVL